MSKSSIQVLEQNSASISIPEIPLVRVDTALTSLRSSGHDPSSAVGEVADNSIEAGSNNIRIHLFTEKKIGVKKSIEVVERVAIGDDGKGMNKVVLHQALSLGFSTRFNSRIGMGRFGVGAKLGAISQAKRIDIYSRQSGDDAWLWTYIDLDEISAGTMTLVPEPLSAPLPKDCEHLVGPGSGTLVLWSKTDRLQERDSGGARMATTVISDLVDYLGRTFRKFLDAGINIFVNDKPVKPHDPLFLMTTTRFHQGEAPDPTATILIEESFSWIVPTDPALMSDVHVTMTLLPEKLRPKRGSGGDKAAKDRRIDDERQQGVSILRANREIFFGILRYVQPSPVQDIDRWIGIEIRFSPELDECFAVRNVKKGAEPVNGLRDKLRDIIHKTVMTARKQIQGYWDEKERQKAVDSGQHATAEEIVSKVVAVSPKPRAGQDVSDQEREKKIRRAAQVLLKDSPELISSLADEIRKRPVKIVPENFPGNEWFEIEHLGSTAVIRLNMRHPFYSKIYGRIIEAAADTSSPTDDTPIAKLAQLALDLLICAYALAEGMDPDPNERYSDLRSYWGIHLKNIVSEWKS
ncbi:ATP-binding protein [bacterium]|nr:ATP-binding protein [bacterium]